MNVGRSHPSQASANRAGDKRARSSRPAADRLRPGCDGRQAPPLVDAGRQGSVVSRRGPVVGPVVGRWCHCPTSAARHSSLDWCDVRRRTAMAHSRNRAGYCLIAPRLVSTLHRGRRRRPPESSGGVGRMFLQSGRVSRARMHRRRADQIRFMRIGI